MGSPNLDRPHPPAEAEGDDTALELLQQTKEIWVAVLGPDHPDVALTELNLGAITYASGRTNEAIEHFNTSLEIYERAVGDDHVDVADVLSNLGVAYQDLEKFDEALGANVRALEIYETQLPEGHASIASAQLGVGLAYMGQGEPAKAIGPLEAALDSAIKQDDPEDIATVRFDLARALYAAGQPKRAKPLMQQAAKDFDALDRSDDAEDARRFIRDN